MELAYWGTSCKLAPAGEEKARKEGITEESKIIEQGAKEFIKELQKLSKECSTEGEGLNKIITKKI